MRRLARDLSLSAVVAGFVAVLVGFTSSVVIVFQAAQALGATPAQTASWIWALGLGMGLTCIGLSLWLPPAGAHRLVARPARAARRAPSGVRDGRGRRRLHGLRGC